MKKEKLDKEILCKIFHDYEVNHKDRLIYFLGLYRQGEYIYPDVLKRNLKCSSEEAFEILDMLVENKIAEKCFQYYCPRCEKPVGPFLTEDVESYCDSCDEALDATSKHYAYHII